MKMHDLKTWPEYFDAIISGAKLFEVRKDDRGFTVGDTLLLREWDPKHSWYTGRTVSRRVTYVLTGPAFGIEAGFVCMGIIEAELSKQEPAAYRCFHCREEFTDDAAAELHFGRSELDKPACQISIEHVRWLEQQHHRGVQDDTEALRTIRGMLSEHETLRRRAEEEGYAKGLADARKG